MSNVAKPPKPPGESAAVAPEDENQEPQLRLIGLVKKAAKAIAKTLDAKDRLGIVTFGTSADVVQQLVPMDDSGKKETKKNIKSIKVKGCTNLWDGLIQGLEVLQGTDEERGPTTGLAIPKNTRSSVKTLMVLTDGLPNHGEPSRGYMPQLARMRAPDVTIHTFGFGYSLRSGLLKSIAEFGQGNYLFIPDEGMLVSWRLQTEHVSDEEAN